MPTSSAVRPFVVSTADIQETAEPRVTRAISAVAGHVSWWLLCIVTPVVGVAIGLCWGAIVGAAMGVYAGVSESKEDLRKWYKIMVKE